MGRVAAPGEPGIAVIRPAENYAISVPSLTLRICWERLNGTGIVSDPHDPTVQQKKNPLRRKARQRAVEEVISANGSQSRRCEVIFVGPS